MSEMNFCQRHGKFENNKMKKVYVSGRGLEGFIICCQKAIQDYRNNNVKVEILQIAGEGGGKWRLK